MPNPLVFLCGARDFHAMDWYRRAKELLPDREVCILTDLVAGEGFKKLVNNNDVVFKLIIIDKLLLNKQSNFGNVWRNVVKLLLFPIQVALIKRFSSRNPDAIYYAHSMYYLFLGMAAGIKYVGRPQGSDILIKPHTSKLFRYFAIKSLAAAKAVIVDSNKMKDAISEFSKKDINVHVIRNGIDIESISSVTNKVDSESVKREAVLSIRGLTSLYRIKDIVLKRNSSPRYRSTPLTFIYPFYEDEYRNALSSLLTPSDVELGSLDKAEMYQLLARTKLVISIPESDSSPRSVYEAIFCGCAVAITHNSYYDVLPRCMKERIVLVDIDHEDWLDKAIEGSNKIISTRYYPSDEALSVFDQNRSFREMEALLFG